MEGRNAPQGLGLLRQKVASLISFLFVLSSIFRLFFCVWCLVLLFKVFYVKLNKQPIQLIARPILLDLVGQKLLHFLLNSLQSYPNYLLNRIRSIVCVMQVSHI